MMSHGFRKAAWWLVAALPIMAPVAAANTFVPAAAAAAGYDQLTFSSTFAKGARTGVDEVLAGGQWFLWDFFGQRAGASEVGAALDGGLRLAGGSTGPNGQLVSAARAPNGRGIAGTAFGGGAYIEAAVSFDAADVTKADSVGHPSFWAMSLEHVLPPVGAHARTDVPANFTEVDVFEYDLSHRFGPYAYGATAHNWYGVWHQTCTKGFCDDVQLAPLRRVPRRTSWQAFHKYAVLWVPATARTAGSLTFFFDGVAVGKKLSWRYCPPGSQPGDSTYSPMCILDHQHLVLILGTGVGQPMTVKNVRVFQASARYNIEKP